MHLLNSKSKVFGIIFRIDAVKSCVLQAHTRTHKFIDFHSTYEQVLGIWMTLIKEENERSGKEEEEN